jgi:hypothetical protein
LAHRGVSLLAQEHVLNGGRSKCSTSLRRIPTTTSSRSSGDPTSSSPATCSTRQFPVIDVERGGASGRDRGAQSARRACGGHVAGRDAQASTIVVPGHGRLCDQYDVVEYRDMVTIIRDRVRDLIKAGRSLAEVQAAQPAKGYMGRYGNPGGVWTTDRFIEAVYRSLAKGKS